MENKKLDLNSIIGFALIFGILIWIMYANQPSNEEIAAEKAKKEQVSKEEKVESITKKEVATLQTTSISQDTSNIAAVADVCVT